MVKQLIALAIFFLIQDVLKAIHFTRIIFHFYTNVNFIQDAILRAKILVERDKKSFLLTYLMQKLCKYIVQQIFC